MLIQWAKTLFRKLQNLFCRRKAGAFDMPKDFERGIFQHDEKTGKLVKVLDKIRTAGVYAMELQEYLHRKHHVSKGSWKRPIDKEHASKEALAQDDYGQLGCKGGRGFFHPMVNGLCKYCGLNAGRIKLFQQDKESQ